ncbi:MAG: hypothetical protein IPQ07_33040 [Myxococcales bacterium]|nr:hypothetical protein [Myxococcales bacterium]
MQVGARPILGWWAALSAAGVDELAVIRGYKGDVLETFVRQLVLKVTVRRQPGGQPNNVLLSMACAQFLDQPTYLTSDIIFTPAVAGGRGRPLTAEIGLVIDRKFRDIYACRTEHPLEEGEVSDLMHDGSVARIGKRAPPPAR